MVESSVTVPIEQQVNGVEGMMYMASNSSNDGSMSATVTFEVGYDLNIAAVDVQNRVQIAQPQLPEEVQRQGVRVTKQSTDLTLVVNLISPDGSRDNLFLSNYAGINVTDRLKRLPGVGQVTQFGERRYSMRVWLLPAQLAKLGINAQDVIGVLREQNQQVAAGAIGQPPAPDGQQFQYTLTAKGRLATRGGVRADRGAHAPRRLGAALEGRRARRARRRELRRLQPARTAAGDRHRRLFAADGERARRREGRARRDGPALAAFPVRGRSTRSSTTPRSSSRNP